MVSLLVAIQPRGMPVENGRFSAVGSPEVSSFTSNCPARNLQCGVWPKGGTRCERNSDSAPETRTTKTRMIIQKQADDLLLIIQPDHAALAATIMSSWRADGFPGSPRRDDILFATLHHDDGWLEVDANPLVSAAGEILDFVNAPDPVRLGIWPRAVERLTSTPYVAALVAQHALHIYEAHRAKGQAREFFAEMEALRDGHLANAAPRSLADLLEDYFFVRMGDTLSLAFCNGWTEPVRQAAYEVRVIGSRLIVAPDPFEGREIPLSVSMRRLRHQPFTQSDASAAFARAPLETLKGVASGRQLST